MIRSVIILILLVASLTASFAYWMVKPAPIGISDTEQQSWPPLQLPTIPDAQALANKLHHLDPWQETSQETSERTTHSGESINLSLVGIVQQAKQRYILVTDKDDKVQMYPLASTLPNGGKLTAIYEDAIEVEQRGKTFVIRLYE